MSDLILYTSEDERTRLDLRLQDDIAWLSQLEIAELFQITKNNISLHTKYIFSEGELTAEATVKESLTVQNEGNREVKRKITFYNLDLIFAIGYRVRSPCGTQFRQSNWKTNSSETRSRHRTVIEKNFGFETQSRGVRGD